MSDVHQLNEAITVTAHMLPEQIQPQTITWRKQNYTVTSIGRQWQGEDGRHILVEVHDGSRMEIRLGADIRWYLERYWPATMMA